MNKQRRAWTIYISVGVVAIVLIALMLRPTTLAVDSAIIDRGTLSVSIEEEGQTRARDRYTVAAPITGRLLRTDYKEGQSIKQGDVLTAIAPTPDDARAVATENANVRAAEARLYEVKALLEEAEGNHQRTLNEYQRRNDLYEKGLISVETRDFYAQEAQSAKARVASIKASVSAAEAVLESAKSRLIGTNQHKLEATDVVPVLSPVNGQVIRVLQESERVVSAGSPLFELSAGSNLELVIDLLTQDAVQVKPGDPIVISGWGGEQALQGEVTYIEPGAFTKISTLGVEEQRVNIIGRLLEDAPTLGTGYRIEAAIVVWSQENVLRIPTSAIFRRNNAWHTFVVADGKAELRKIEIGKRNINHAQVLEGIKEEERVIVFPSDLVEEGVRVEVNGEM
jgi:HlyD family secretion protein